MAYLEITESGSGAYDNTKEGIWFKHNSVDNLSFTKSGNDLVIEGEFDGTPFEYTITNYDFSSLSYNNLFKGETEAVELDTITAGYQIGYTASSSFTKSDLGNTSYNWDITVANGTDAEHYTTISISGLGAADTLHLDGTKSKTWTEADKDKLVVRDNTNFKNVTITDYFTNTTKAYYEPLGILDVILACDTPYVTGVSGFINESVHGVGKIAVGELETENYQLAIAGDVTYVREYNPDNLYWGSLFVKGSANGDNIEVTGFSFNDITQGNIYVNGVQTSASTQIDMTLPSNSIFKGSAYRDNITIESNPDPYYKEYTTNVTMYGLASGDILNIQNFNPDASSGWYCNRNMSAGNAQKLTITNANVDDPILTINDYGTSRGTFTFTGLNPAQCHLYVTNASNFDGTQVSDNWGFETFSVTGTTGNDTIKGGSGNDSFNGNGGRDVFIFEGDFGQDSVQQSTAQDEFHFVGVERSKISYNEPEFPYPDYISIAGSTNTVSFFLKQAAPDIIYAVNEAGAFQGYSLQGTFSTMFNVPESGLADNVTISDHDYDGINFLKPDFDTSDLTFERTANTLIVSGITEGKTLTITDFNFGNYSNINALQVRWSGFDKITKHRIAYNLSENYTKSYSSPYKEDITVTTNGVTVAKLQANDSLTVTGASTYHRNMAVDSGSALTIKNEGDDTIVTISDYNRNHEFTLIDGAATRRLTVSNANSFNASNDGWGFDTFDITGAGTLVGNAGADIITATAASTITGGLGNDTLTGGDGEDVYVFTENNFGHDTVYNATSSDTLRFVKNTGSEQQPQYVGYKFSDIVFLRNVNNIDIYVGNNIVTIDNYYTMPQQNKIDKIIALNENNIETEYSMSEIFINLDDYATTYENPYIANPNYSEVFSGSGYVRGLTTKDVLTFTGTTKYTLNNEGLKITGSVGESITFTDYVQGNEPIVCVGNVADDLYDKTLFVENTSLFDASTNFNFYDVEITGTANNDNYKGSSHDDIITGEDGNDTIYGNGGSDTITGGDGNDIIYTGTGDDTIDGGNGNDTICIDGYGTKTITGGEGSDTFFFDKGSAIITDAKNEDIIQFKTFGTEKLNFERLDEDLIISSAVEGDNDTITIQNYFNNDGTVAANHINRFIFGKYGEHTIEWEKSDFDGKYYMHEIIEGTSGKDTLSAVPGIRTQIQGFGNDDTIEGYESIIVGGSGNDKITVAGGGNTICFINTIDAEEPEANQKNFGVDTVSGTTSTDTLRFLTDNGELADPRYVGYAYTPNELENNELKVERAENNLLIYPVKNSSDNYVILSNYFTQDESDRVKDMIVGIKNGSGDIIGSQTLDLNKLVENQVYGEENIYTEDKLTENKGKVVINKNTPNNSDVMVDATTYISYSASGINVNNKNNTVNLDVTGSAYNDTITSKGNGNNTIVEKFGTNKITTGKGVDSIITKGYSSNTINVGDGNNIVTLGSMGTNKVTAGNNDNTVTVNIGSNNIKLGNGSNSVELNGGTNTIKLGNAKTTTIGNVAAHNEIVIDNGDNKITSGSGQDEFYIYEGNNTINSGNGIDTFEINGGYNTINTGNGQKVPSDPLNPKSKKISEGDIININGGYNSITSGGFNDHYTIENGNNQISSGAGVDTFILNGGFNTINGGAGNDTYSVNLTAGSFDFTNGNIYITDVTGANVLDLTVGLTDSVKLFFDVDLKKDKKGNIITKKGNNAYTYSAMTFTTEDIDSDINGVDVINNKSISKVKINGEEHDISTKQVKNDIAALAQDVANWLTAGGRNYDSVSEALQSNDANIGELINKYTVFSEQLFN